MDLRSGSKPVEVVSCVETPVMSSDGLTLDAHLANRTLISPGKCRVSRLCWTGPRDSWPRAPTVVHSRLLHGRRSSKMH